MRQYVTKVSPLSEPLSGDRSADKSHGHQGLSILSLNDAKVIKVRGDGRCLYHALGRGSLNDGEDLRQTICDEIMHNPDRTAYKLGDSNVSYASDIEMNHGTSVGEYITTMRGADGSPATYGAT